VAAVVAAQALGCAHVLHGQRVHLRPAAAPQWPLRQGALVRMILVGKVKAVDVSKARAADIGGDR